MKEGKVRSEYGDPLPQSCKKVSPRNIVNEISLYNCSSNDSKATFLQLSLAHFSRRVVTSRSLCVPPQSGTQTRVGKDVSERAVSSYSRDRSRLGVEVRVEDLHSDRVQVRPVSDDTRSERVVNRDPVLGYSLRHPQSPFLVPLG